MPSSLLIGIRIFLHKRHSEPDWWHEALREKLRQNGPVDAAQRNLVCWFTNLATMEAFKSSFPGQPFPDASKPLYFCAGPEANEGRHQSIGREVRVAMKRKLEVTVEVRAEYQCDPGEK